jgi:hypothetical protein
VGGARPRFCELCHHAKVDMASEANERTRSAERSLSGPAYSANDRSAYSSRFSDDSASGASSPVVALSESSAVSSAMSRIVDKEYGQDEGDAPPWAAPAASARAPAAAVVPAFSSMAAPPAASAPMAPPTRSGGHSPTGTSSRSYSAGEYSDYYDDDEINADAETMFEVAAPAAAPTAAPVAAPMAAPTAPTTIPCAAPTAAPVAAPAATPAAAPTLEPPERQASSMRPAESCMTSVSGVSGFSCTSISDGSTDVPARAPPPAVAPSLDDGSEYSYYSGSPQPSARLPAAFSAGPPTSTAAEPLLPASHAIQQLAPAAILAAAEGVLAPDGYRAPSDEYEYYSSNVYSASAYCSGSPYSYATRPPRCRTHLRVRFPFVVAWLTM